jgi:hypothetical protein
MDELDTYLERLKSALAPLGADKSADITMEIRAHIQDSMEESGKSLGETLEALGNPEALAANYLEELKADSEASGAKAETKGGASEGRSGADEFTEEFLRRLRDRLNFSFTGGPGRNHWGPGAGPGEWGEWGEKMGAWARDWGMKFGEEMRDNFGAAFASIPRAGFPPMDIKGDFPVGERVRIKLFAANLRITRQSDDSRNLSFRGVIRATPGTVWHFSPREDGGVDEYDFSEAEREGFHLEWLEVRLPAGLTECQLESMAGEIRAAGLSAALFTVKATAGNLELSDIDGDLKLECQAGNVELARISGTVDALCKAGNLRLSDSPSCQGGTLTSSAGNIDLQGDLNQLRLDLSTKIGQVLAHGQARGTAYAEAEEAGKPTLRARTEFGNIRAD